MITTRLALVMIRLVLALVALAYAVLKLFVETGATPLFGLTARDTQSAILPINTNPTFAATVIVLSVVVSGALLFFTSRGLVSDYRRFGYPAPFASPIEIVLTTLFACFSVYYFVIAILADGRWYYSGTLALIAVLLSIYEGRQYADFGKVKTHPVDH